MGANDLDDIEERLAGVEERVAALPTVAREEDAAVHAHAAFALLRAMLLSLPPVKAREVCDAALSFIGENPDGIFPQYLEHAIADAVRSITEGLRS